VAMAHRYEQLSLEERDMINEMKVMGESVRATARALQRSPSTISRELRRNAAGSPQIYLSHLAQTQAMKRKREAARRPRLKDRRVVEYVREKLTLDWSPEQIAGRIGQDLPGASISYEAIYQYIYHPETEGRIELIHHLRRTHRLRKPKWGARKKHKTKIPNRISINERPASVETRRWFGHWEGDSLICRRSTSALNTLIERKSRFAILTKLPHKTAEQTSRAVIQKLRLLPRKARRTLTLDNGPENARHGDITRALGTQCYFADSYASWQRGSNENLNGLVRWYFPKRTDFNIISEEQVARVEALLNNRPRKCLGYKTPAEIARVALLR